MAVKTKSVKQISRLLVLNKKTQTTLQKEIRLRIDNGRKFQSDLKIAKSNEAKVNIDTGKRKERPRTKRI